MPLKFVSTEAKGSNSFPGIFILQIEIAKLQELLGRNTSVVNADGIYMINARSELSNTPHQYRERFSSLQADDSGAYFVGFGMMFLLKEKS